MIGFFKYPIRSTSSIRSKGRGNMSQQSQLENFFESYIQRTSLFNDKTLLQTNYVPEMILHREEQIEQLGPIFGPVLRKERPSNVFIYGKTGVGKTATVRKLIATDLVESAHKRKVPLSVIYVNCKLKRVADTEYRLLAHLITKLGGEAPKGLHTEEINNIFVQEVEDKGIVIFILDEIDYLLKKAGDNILYMLSRINEELKGTQIAIIGISNVSSLTEHIDPRVRSSLSEEDILFHPYNAEQLKDILKQRAKKAFKQGVLEPGVLEKCAAHAANEHGDARKAVELLRVSGELAERQNEKKVQLKHIDEAEKKIEHSRVFEMIMSQPQQVKLTFFTILKLAHNRKGMIFTGELYEAYKNFCSAYYVHPLTQRRMSDILAELDEAGFINARIISKGRYGRTREITLSIPRQTLTRIEKSLEESLGVGV